MYIKSKLSGVKGMSYIILVICLMAIANFIAAPVEANVKRDIEKEKLEQKINELKQKENIEIKKLTTAQKHLEKTKKTIQNCKNQLWKSRLNMSKLESRLNNLQRERQKLSKTAGKRIREIYKGERISLLHVIFASQDLATFFDRLYYQKAMIKKDKELMANLKQKSNDIIRSQRSIAYEKRNISSSLSYMSRKKRKLDYSVQTSEYLIQKLRTDRQAYEQAQRELAKLSKNIEQDISSLVSTETLIDSVFIRPVIGSITSPFGWRRHPIFGSRRFHSGVDIAGRNRSPIKASNSGKVIHSGWYGGYGKVVIINHGILADGTYKGKKVSTLYAHLSRTDVSVGNYVKKGQIIGHEGSTGYSTGPHLHFEIRIDGKPVNPLGFIK